MKTKTELLLLCETLAEFDEVTHWGISMRVTRRGDFFKGLMSGVKCRKSTYRKYVKKFSEIWPDDLDWPKGITRPLIIQKDAA